MSDSDEEYAYSEDEEDDELHWYDNQGTALAAKPSANYGGHKPKVAKTEFMKMNKKVPPYFDGRKSWFTFEDELDDWVELTEEPAEKQAILVKQRLIDDAEYWKPLLENNKLKTKNGVRYLKDTLRPHYVKGANLLFIWRFLTLINLRRPSKMEMLQWIPRVQTKKKRTLDAWMNCAALCDEKDDEAYLKYVETENLKRTPSGTASAGARTGEPTPAESAAAKAKSGVPAKAASSSGVPASPASAEEPDVKCLLAEHDDTLELYNDFLKAAQRKKFPLSENVMALLFLVSADLNEQQRERLISTLTLQGVTIENYTTTKLEDTFRDLFASAKTNLADPFISRGGRDHKAPT